MTNLTVRTPHPPVSGHRVGAIAPSHSQPKTATGAGGLLWLVLFRPALSRLAHRWHWAGLRIQAWFRIDWQIWWQERWQA